MHLADALWRLRRIGDNDLGLVGGFLGGNCQQQLGTANLNVAQPSPRPFNARF